MPTAQASEGQALPRGHAAVHASNVRVSGRSGGDLAGRRMRGPPSRGRASQPARHPGRGSVHRAGTRLGPRRPAPPPRWRTPGRATRTGVRARPGAEHEIEGFADRVSVLPGERFRLLRLHHGRPLHRAGLPDGLVRRGRSQEGVGVGAPARQAAGPARDDRRDPHGDRRPLEARTDRRHLRLARGLLPPPAGRRHRRPALRPRHREIRLHPGPPGRRQRGHHLAGLQPTGAAAASTGAPAVSRTAPGRSASTVPTTPRAPGSSWTWSATRSRSPNAAAFRSPTSPTGTSTTTRTSSTAPRA